eukprot:g30352.t1
MADYQLEKYCVCVHFEKSQVDSKGDYIFDDAFWDENGYHPQPAGCWIPQERDGAENGLRVCFETSFKAPRAATPFPKMLTSSQPLLVPQPNPRSTGRGQDSIACWP